VTNENNPAISYCLDFQRRFALMSARIEHLHEELLMHAHERAEAKNLSRSRKWLWSNGHMRYELAIEERAQRVAEYARQVATYGEIVQYLPWAEPKERERRSRFDDGDALHPRARIRRVSSH
jgi:hypothetical protein